MTHLERAVKLGTMSQGCTCSAAGPAMPDQACTGIRTAWSACSWTACCVQKACMQQAETHPTPGAEASTRSGQSLLRCRYLAAASRCTWVCKSCTEDHISHWLLLGADLLHPCPTDAPVQHLDSCRQANQTGLRVPRSQCMRTSQAGHSDIAEAPAACMHAVTMSRGSETRWHGAAPIHARCLHRVIGNPHVALGFRV